MRIGRTVQRLERRLLQRLYGFNGWHVGHADEPYVADIVRHLNGQPESQREAAAEIGCGLGDIIRRLRFRTRLGLDRDAGALRAARLLALSQRKSDLRFELFEFPQAPLTGTYDAIVMVNWIHQIDPGHLRPVFHSYCEHHLRPGGAVVLDTVEDPAYTYNHDVHALAPPGAAVVHLGRYPRDRHVWVVKPV